MHLGRVKFFGAFIHRDVSYGLGIKDTTGIEADLGRWLLGSEKVNERTRYHYRGGGE